MRLRRRRIHESDVRRLMAEGKGCAEITRTLNKLRGENFLYASVMAVMMHIRKQDLAAEKEQVANPSPEHPANVLQNRLAKHALSDFRISRKVLFSLVPRGGIEPPTP